MTPTEYVVKTTDDGWRIAGSRVSLDSVIHAYWNGRLPEAIVADFPSLTLEQVHGAIAHYLRHQTEIDRHFAAQDGRWTAFRQECESNHGPLLRRIRQSTPAPARAP